jgi:hypothetical protein
MIQCQLQFIYLANVVNLKNGFLGPIDHRREGRIQAGIQDARAGTTGEKWWMDFEVALEHDGRV